MKIFYLLKRSTIYINLWSLAYANHVEYERLHKTYNIGMCMHMIGYLGYTDSCL